MRFSTKKTLKEQRFTFKSNDVKGFQLWMSMCRNPFQEMTHGLNPSLFLQTFCCSPPPKFLNECWFCTNKHPPPRAEEVGDPATPRGGWSSLGEIGHGIFGGRQQLVTWGPRHKGGGSRGTPLLSCELNRIGRVQGGGGSRIWTDKKNKGGA